MPIGYCSVSAAASATAAAMLNYMQDHMSAPATNNIAARIGDFYLTSTPLQQAGFVLWLAAGLAAGALYKYAQDDSSSSRQLVAQEEKAEQR